MHNTHLTRYPNANAAILKLQNKIQTCARNNNNNKDATSPSLSANPQIRGSVCFTQYVGVNLVKDFPVFW